jgi:ABC-type phosphonate transport system ATPase subunit
MKGGADQPLLEIGGLEKSFGGRKVLIDIGLALWPGEVRRSSASPDPARRRCCAASAARSRLTAAKSCSTPAHRAWSI